MKQWFYSEDGRQKGPVSEERLREMHRNGDLRDDSLVWTDGMAEWRAVASIPGWEPSPYASPAPPPDAEAVPVNWDGYEASGPQARPWVRYWARFLDTALAVLAFGLLAGAAAPFLMDLPGLVLGMVMLGGTLLSEPMCFALFGTTPGKALLNVRVRNRDGTRLSFGRAFGRRLSVLIRGEGLGIPVIAVFTQILAYSRLKKHGATSWDEHSGFVVSHREIEVWRWMVLAALVFGFLSLVVLGSES